MENLEFGFGVMVVGFAVVMAILYLLYFILIGFNHIFAQTPPSETKQKNSDAGVTTSLSEATAAPVAATVSPPEPVQSTDVAPEVAAVISAAVACYLDGPAVGISITPVGSTHQPAFNNAWSLAGRKRLMERRQDLSLLRRERRK